MIDLSVIVPAYNEEANIGRSAAGVVEYLKAGARSWELLVVDDGSTDSTLALAEGLAAAEPRVMPTTRRRSRSSRSSRPASRTVRTSRSAPGGCPAR